MRCGKRASLCSLQSVTTQAHPCHVLQTRLRVGGSRAATYMKQLIRATYTSAVGLTRLPCLGEGHRHSVRRHRNQQARLGLGARALPHQPRDRHRGAYAGPYAFVSRLQAYMYLSAPVGAVAPASRRPNARRTMCRVRGLLRLASKMVPVLVASQSCCETVLFGSCPSFADTDAALSHCLSIITLACTFMRAAAETSQR